MGKISTICGILLISSIGFAKDTRICQDKLLALLEMDPTQEYTNTEKHFSGVITAASDSYFKIGDPCEARIFVSASHSKRGGDISFIFKGHLAVLDPFNHDVEMDNSSGSCSSSSMDEVSGDKHYQLDSGWHTRFYTAVGIGRLTPLVLDLTYRDESYKISCQGNFSP
jgi:hypothetical protein